MADDSEKLSGAEEYVVAEIELAERSTRTGKNRDALEVARTLRSCDIGAEKFALDDADLER